MLGIFDPDERILLLKRRVRHLPCYVHVIREGDYHPIIKTLIKYYHPYYYPAPMNEPFRDNLP